MRNNQPGELDTKGGSVFIDFGENRGMAGVSESERIRDAVGREGDIAGQLDDEIALDQSPFHPLDWAHASIDWMSEVMLLLLRYILSYESGHVLDTCMLLKQRTIKRL